MSRWPGLRAHVAFANVDSVFDASIAPNAGSPLSRRAAAMLAGQGTVVAYDQQLDAPGRVHWPTVHVQRRTGDLCLDLLDDGPAFDAIRKAAERLPRPWPIWAQVYTPTMDTLSHELVRHGFDRSLLPRCSGVSVAHWNSKRGGADLLQRAVGSRHPLSVACSTVADAAGRAQRHEGRWVVKANRSMGGVGVTFVDGRADAEEVAAAIAATVPVQPAPYGKSAASKERLLRESVLLQVLVGDPATNRSPSADFWVEHDGSTTMVGFAEQLLDAEVRYVGSRSCQSGWDEVTMQASAAGDDVGRILFTEGYRGLFNLDFVVSADRTFAVIEINLRQSAPVDQSLTMRRRYGDTWERTHGFQAHEPGTGREAVYGDVLRYGNVDDGLMMFVHEGGG